MIGCCLMMWQYNTQNHCTIGNIPYRLVFGQLPCVGISALPLDISVLTQLATEAQLNCVCNYVGKVDVLDNETEVVEAIDNVEEDQTAICDEIQANTNNSNNHEYVAAVGNYDVNGSGAADDNLSEIAGCAACAPMREVLQPCAVFGWHSHNHPQAHRLPQ